MTGFKPPSKLFEGQPPSACSAIARAYFQGVADEESDISEVQNFINQELINMIKKLINERVEHNDDYHHITDKSLLNQARILIGEGVKID